MKRLVMLVAGIALALTVGVASAYFTGQAQVPENVIRAGTVGVYTEPTSAALSIPALAPGSEVKKTLSVVNHGTLPASIVITPVKKAGTTALYEALTCRVTRGETVLYEGRMSAMRTTAFVQQPGQRDWLQFHVGLVSEAGNDLAGEYAKLSLYVDAEQVH